MIRVAIVGAGGMAHNYRSVYANLPGVKWALAVDTSPAVLEACKAEGVERVSSNFADALAPEIDMVDVSTPNFLHEEQAVAALQAGKHVLLQKPMANTLEAADRIVAAARKSRGKLGMYMSSYTQPVVWEIKRLLESGALGKLQSIRARDAHRGGLTAKKELWRGSREKTGGGCFVQLSIHSINLMQWWLGSRITEVSAFSDNQHCPTVGGDDVTTAVVKFAGGAYGAFDSGWASAGGTREIYGTQGYLRLLGAELELELDEAWQGKVIAYSTPKQRARLPFETPKLSDASNPLNQQRLFIEHVAAGKPPHMTGEDGRQDLAVVTAAYEAADKGGRTRVRQL
jgi:predicted dehydrogenase